MPNAAMSYADAPANESARERADALPAHNRHARDGLASLARSEPAAAAAEPELAEPHAEPEEVEPIPAEARPRFSVHFRPWVFTGEPPEAARPPGLYWLGTKGKGDAVELIDERISGPIVCPALTLTEDRETFGRLLCFRDHDGRERQVAVPCSAVAGDGLELLRLLLDAGLEVVPRQGRRLVEYVGTRAPRGRMMHVVTTGWLADRSAFVLPFGSIGRGDVVFQCRPQHRASGPRTAGDFGRWRETIGAWAAANWRFAFKICAALSPPLYALLGITPGGFHDWATTSVGKSTTGDAAASCWGFGGKPYVHGWKGTHVGLEGAATLANDLPLFLDEIKEATAADFEAVLYFLINGRGKLRGAREGGLRAIATWRTVIISNGEYPIEQHLRAAGIDYPPGLRARIADIRIDGGRFGIFDDLCGFATADDFAKAIAAAGMRDYGHAGPALVETIIRRRGELAELFDVAKQALEATGNVARRVADRFAAAAVAGELAADAAILPWKTGFATEAVRRAFAAWQAGAPSEHGGLSVEDQAIVSAVLGFLETQRARFQADGLPPPQNRAGFVEIDGFGREVFRIFKAALIGDRQFQRWSPARIAEALDKAGLLAERDADGGRRWRKAKIEGRQERVLVVAPHLRATAPALEPDEERDAA